MTLRIFMLPTPPSVNALYRNVPRVGRVKTGKAKSWHLEAAVILKQQGVTPLHGPVSITYQIGRYPDKRKRDVANFEKALSDCLVANKIIDDDSLIESLTIEWSNTQERGQTKVIIYGLRASVGREAA